MSVERLLDQVHEHRAAGTLLAASGRGGSNSDVLVGLLWKLRDRSQLDRLVDGLAGATAVADRAERALRLTGPVPASIDDLEGWGYACLSEWVGLARRRCSEGPVLAAFEALADMAVEVVDADEQSDEASFRLNGSLLGEPASQEDSELSADQLALIHSHSFELLAAEMADGAPDGWGGLDLLFSMALDDEPAFGAWLISPAASWAFDFEPFYNLWRAGVSLWVSPDMIEAVQESAIWVDSSFGTGPAKPTVVSDADKKWVQGAGPDAEEALSLIVYRTATGRCELELLDFGLLSLPPALVVDGGWTVLHLGYSPGLDPARLSELDRLEILAIQSCELASFDIDLPPGLKRIRLHKNLLTKWPAGLAAAGSELVRLNLQRNQLTEVPDDIGALTELQDLNLAGNNITKLSDAIGQLSKLEYLALSSNRELASLPESILQLSSDCQVALDATALPESFHKAKTIGQLRDAW